MKNTIPQIFQEFSHKYVGLPYASYDCYELVRLFYRDILGEDFDVYNYNDSMNFEETANIINSVKHGYKKVTEPKFGDIILVMQHGLPSHLGIFINDVYFLHTTKKTGCILDRIAVYQYKIEGIYRHD